MATCPRCFGPLVEGHRCSPRVWRRVAKALPSIVLGGVVGAAACFGLDDHPGLVLVLIAASLGSLLGVAATRALRGEV